VIDRKTLTNIAVIAVITMAALFFYHVKSGSFSATHGPVSAMRAAREAFRIKMSVISASITAITVMTVVRCWLFSQMPKNDVSTATIAPRLDPPVRI
jgi:hypothetical protein